jgi:hypothetical protein
MNESKVLVLYGILLMLFAVLSFVAGLPAINLMPRESAIVLAMSFAFAGVVFWVSAVFARQPGADDKEGEDSGQPR